MPQLDPTSFVSQIFWLAITFGVTFIIMWRIAVPKIADVLEARQFRMSENRERAEEFQKEAEAAHAAYEKALADARADAQAEIARINQELADKTAEQEAALNARLKERIAESEKAIDDAVAAALANVRDTAVEAATAAAEKLSGDSVDANAVAGAVDTALKVRG